MNEHLEHSGLDDLTSTFKRLHSSQFKDFSQQGIQNLWGFPIKYDQSQFFIDLIPVATFTAAYRYSP